MTRLLLTLLTLSALLTDPVLAFAQVDFDAIKSGVAGCPELAADPDVGNLAAFLCRPANRTTLDSPINLTTRSFWEVRAGSFHPYTRAVSTRAARPSLGDSEYARLQNLLLNAQVLSSPQEAYRIALLAEASEAEAAGDSELAAVLRAMAAAILGTPETVFDANIPELLATRIDRDRYADFRSGLLRSLGARDTVSQYDLGTGETIQGNIGGLPFASDADGLYIYGDALAKSGANPFFVGPDGIRDTADDLPYVANNALAQAAGYRLAAPIAGTFEDRFDNGAYSKTAQITVPSATQPAATKVVELYGVYSQAFLASLGCSPLHGTFDAATGKCSLGAVDITAAASQRGCTVQANIASSLNIGTNADGDCIEVNMSAQSAGSQLQFEVIGLLGDLNARPVDANIEPVDLTDFRAAVVDGPNNTMPARPRSSESGNVSFPVATSSFRRRADPVSGAPLSAAGSQCLIRTNTSGVAIGPDGIAGDPDDVFPSAGECLLWNPPETPDGPQTLRSTDSVAGLQNVNQSLFHTFCTLSYDPDYGNCRLDRLNLQDFGLVSNIISGVGFLGRILFNGLETIQSTIPDGSTSVIQRGSQNFLSTQFLAIEPLAAQSQEMQDLGVALPPGKPSAPTLQPGQQALLGCGPAYASSCSKNQWNQWNDSPAIRADLTRDTDLGPSKVGGIDLMNAVGSVVTQEFTTLKQLRRSALVGTTADATGQLAYLPGVNYSRNGQALYDVDVDFTRQGAQKVVPPQFQGVETGAYLSLTPNAVVDLGAVGRAQFQTRAGNMLEADGWIEAMPWQVNQEMFEKFGAIVFNTDPKNVLDLDSPLNKWNLIDPNQDPNDSVNIQYSDIDGEYCSRWMSTKSDQAVATPFNLGCTGLETVSANLERAYIGGEIIGQDHVFDPPETLQELVAMLDGDPSNDATGDPISGPDGIFARNQFVLSDEEADFEVIAAVPAANFGGVEYVTVPVVSGEDIHVTAERFLLNYEPNNSCAADWCYLNVDDVLVDHPTDAVKDPNPNSHNRKTLIVAMPIGMWVAGVDVADPNNPNDTPPLENGTFLRVNLARLQYFELPSLRRLLAGQAIAIQTTNGREFVQMNRDQRNTLFGVVGALGNQPETRGQDLDVDTASDLDRNRDGIWDGQDDYMPGPISDDNPVCGSSIPGDKLQDGVQYSPYRADQRPGSPMFHDLFPDGLPPRSVVLCRELNALLALAGPIPGAVAGESDAFLWQGGVSASGTDDDADGFPDVVDSCPTITNASQADADGDGVGDSCDNCVNFPNPRVAVDYLRAHPWAVLTGGQRDDDHDGFGNLCDADFTPTGVTVGPADLTEYRASSGKKRAAETCGTEGNRPCSIFDLDEAGECIGPDDLTRYRELSGRRPGPKCVLCPLVCETGEPGRCD